MVRAPRCGRVGRAVLTFGLIQVLLTIYISTRGHALPPSTYTLVNPEKASAQKAARREGPPEPDSAGTAAKASPISSGKAAVAVMVSKYISDGRPSAFRDELISLAQSVYEVNQRSRWDLELVALCLEDKVNEQAMAELREIGFTIVAKPAFTTWDEIEAVGTYTPDMLEDYNNKDLEESFGGMLLDVSKLWAMTLVYYDRVLVVDADVLLLEPIDEIWGKSGDYLLTTTHDWCMLSASNRFPVVQSGFLLFTPRLASPHFEKIRTVYRAAQFRKNDGSGWEDSGIGYNWCDSNRPLPLISSRISTPAV